MMSKEEGYYVMGGVYKDEVYKELKEGYSGWRVGPFRSEESAQLVRKALALDWSDTEFARFYVSHSSPESYWVVGGRYKDTSFQESVEGEEERYGPFEDYESAHEVWQSKSLEFIDDCMVRYRLDKIG